MYHITKLVTLVVASHPAYLPALPSGFTARTVDPLQGPADCDARRSRLRNRVSERLQPQVRITIK